MKLYGLVKLVWLIDERMSVPDADSVELYESPTERDERLLYLNGGHQEDFFDGADDYYTVIDFEVGKRNKVNEPYKDPDTHEPLPGELESKLFLMAMFMEHPFSK